LFPKGNRIPVQYPSRTLKQRDLQIRRLQDFDDRRFQTRYFQAILDPAYEAERVDIGTDVLQ
jgi:hypothetical protein